MKITNEQYARSLAESCLAADSRQWSKIVDRFCAILSVNGDTNQLSGIIKELPIVWDALNGELTAEVKSARKLDVATLDKLATWLSAKTKTNITCQPVIDPTVIGGAVISYGDHILDLSLAGGLKQLITTLAE